MIRKHLTRIVLIWGLGLTGLNLLACAPAAETAADKELQHSSEPPDLKRVEPALSLHQLARWQQAGDREQIQQWLNRHAKQLPQLAAELFVDIHASAMLYLPPQYPEAEALLGMLATHLKQPGLVDPKCGLESELFVAAGCKDIPGEQELFELKGLLNRLQQNRLYAWQAQLKAAPGAASQTPHHAIDAHDPAPNDNLAHPHTEHNHNEVFELQAPEQGAEPTGYTRRGEIQEAYFLRADDQPSPSQTGHIKRLTDLREAAQAQAYAQIEFLICLSLLKAQQSPANGGQAQAVSQTGQPQTTLPSEGLQLTSEQLQRSLEKAAQGQQHEALQAAWWLHQLAQKPRPQASDFQALQAEANHLRQTGLKAETLLRLADLKYRYQQGDPQDYWEILEMPEPASVWALKRLQVLSAPDKAVKARLATFQTQYPALQAALQEMRSLQTSPPVQP